MTHTPDDEQAAANEIIETMHRADEAIAMDNKELGRSLLADLEGQVKQFIAFPSGDRNIFGADGGGPGQTFEPRDKN